MVCNALVAGGRLLRAEKQTMHPGWGRLCNSHKLPHPGCITCCPAPNSQPPATKALHTICSNNTSIVSSSWLWAYKCPKHVEQTISTIKHSVASSWFSSLRLYYDAWTNIHQGNLGVCCYCMVIFIHTIQEVKKNFKAHFIKPGTRKFIIVNPTKRSQIRHELVTSLYPDC